MLWQTQDNEKQNVKIKKLNLVIPLRTDMLGLHHVRCGRSHLVRGKFAVEALEILQYQPQRGAKMLYKVIESALNNAQNPDQPGGAARTANLRVANVQVDGAPMFKRLRPRARGMAFMIKKRLSHINVTLAEASDE